MCISPRNNGWTMVHFKSGAVAHFKSAAISFCRERTAIIFVWPLINRYRGLVNTSLSNERQLLFRQKADCETLDRMKTSNVAFVLEDIGCKLIESLHILFLEVRQFESQRIVSKRPLNSLPWVRHIVHKENIDLTKSYDLSTSKIILLDEGVNKISSSCIKDPILERINKPGHVTSLCYASQCICLAKKCMNVDLSVLHVLSKIKRMTCLFNKLILTWTLTQTIEFKWFFGFSLTNKKQIYFYALTKT